MHTDVRLFDPLLSIHRMREELDRFFGDEALSARPPVNLWTGAEDAVLTAQLPGVHPENLDISIEDDVLTLSGERPETATAGEEEVVRRERLTGRFSRTLRLPFRVDAEKTTARFKNGILTVTLPKAAEEKPKKIAVKAA